MREPDLWERKHCGETAGGTQPTQGFFLDRSPVEQQIFEVGRDTFGPWGLKLQACWLGNFKTFQSELIHKQLQLAQRHPPPGPSLHSPLVCVVSSCQCDTNLDIPGGRKSQMKNCLHQIDSWACLGGIFLVANYGHMSTMGSACP